MNRFERRCIENIPFVAAEKKSAERKSQATIPEPEASTQSNSEAYHHGKILGSLVISRLLLRPTFWLLSAAHLSI